MLFSAKERLPHALSDLMGEESRLASLSVVHTYIQRNGFRFQIWKVPNRGRGGRELNIDRGCIIDQVLLL